MEVIKIIGVVYYHSFKYFHNEVKTFLTDSEIIA